MGNIETTGDLVMVIIGIVFCCVFFGSFIYLYIWTHYTKRGKEAKELMGKCEDFFMFY
jgi:hypothetical protein